MQATARLWTALCLICIVTLAAEAQPLQATVTATGVEVRNVTAGGQVVVMTASLEADGGLLRQRTGATRFTDDDRDGIVRYVAKRSIPIRSIWIVVDFESGRSVIAAPEGYPLTVLPVPESLLKREAEGIVGLFGSEVVSAQMLIVRPKSGAWRLVAAEGGPGDADKKSNGKLDLAAAAALPVGGSEAPPKHLRKGDVLAVIDPGRMEAFVTEIAR